MRRRWITGRPLRGPRRARSHRDPRRANVFDESGASPGLVRVAYELVDAHEDTVRLAAGLQHDLRWAQHLDYLRALQRAGREALARASSEGGLRGRRT